MRWTRGALTLGSTLVLSTLATSPGEAQMVVSETDRAAIVATALDYIEGWHQADPDRMARSLHDDLAKRISKPGPDGVRALEHMGKATLVEYTGRARPHDDVDFRKSVKILDVFGGAAVVRVDADQWVDYLQIAKIGERWLIVNVLWELR